jgi:hypothetical protein
MDDYIWKTEIAGCGASWKAATGKKGDEMRK